MSAKEGAILGTKLSQKFTEVFRHIPTEEPLIKKMEHIYYMYGDMAAEWILI
jgi:hypothetical protein